MTKIESIDRASFTVIRTAIEEALKGVGEELGIQLKAGSGSYGFTNGTLKLEMALVNADGTVETKEATDFRANAHHYGVDPEALGKEFESRGRTLRLVGLSIRSRKYPFLAEEVGTGRVYKFQRQVVQFRFPLPEGAES